MASRDGRTPDAEARAALSRRSFLKGAGGGVVASALTGGLAARATAATAPPAEGLAETAQDQAGVETLSGSFPITLRINGKDLSVRVQPQTTLLSALRHHVVPPLTGTKEVCDRGNCGACTVLVDGRPVYSCMQLAATMPGKALRTIEGVGSPDDLSPLQDAICKHDGLMCGFCTPGFVMASTACLEKHGDPGLDTIKHELSGNLCRCGTYTHIFDAVQTAAKGGK